MVAERRWQHRLRRTVGVLAGLVLCGCGEDATRFTAGVRVDQLLVRDIAVTVTETSAVFNWTTRDERESDVLYGTTRNLGQVAVEPGNRTVHQVTVTGLTADTLYHYRLRGRNEIYRLRTLGGARERIAFVSDRNDGRQEVYLAYELGENVTRVTTGGGRRPAISNDGTRLAWLAPGAGGLLDLYWCTLDAAGMVPGSVVNLTNSADRDELSLDWFPNNRDLVVSASSTAAGSQLLRVNSSTGAETVILANGSALDDPAVSPNGNTIAFISNTRTATVQLRNRPVEPESVVVRLFSATGEVMPAEQYDLYDAANGMIDFSFAPETGQVVFISYTAGGTAYGPERYRLPVPNTELYTVGANGASLRRLTETTERESAPVWQRDGARVVYVREVNGVTSILAIPAAGGGVLTVTRGSVQDRDPTISPDGSTILFSSNRNDSDLINLYQTDFSGEIQELNFFASGDTQPSWSVVP